MNLSGYYKQDLPYYYMAFHKHEFYEIMYVDNGFCTVDIINSRGNTETFHLKKNEFVLLDTNATHKLTVLPEHSCNIFNIEFNVFPVGGDSRYAFNFKNVIRSCSGIQHTLSNTNYIKSKDSHFVKPVIQRIQETFESIGKAGGKHNLEILLQILIGELFLEIDKCCESHNILGNMQIRKAVKFVKTNYQSSITVADIAAHLRVNKSYVHKFFKAYSNTTVHNYLNDYRVEKSIELLQNTDLPVIDVAFEVGFNSRQSYFNAFIKSKGMSPADYRKNRINQKQPQYTKDYITEEVQP